MSNMRNKLCLSGFYTFELWDPIWSVNHFLPMTGYRLVSRQRTPNDIMLAQIDDLLDVYFGNGSPASAWSVGLIGGTSVSITTADSMSSHAGWTEDENYSEANRPAWSPNASASQLKENSTSVVMTLDADTTIRGLFLTSDNTKGGTSGDLWSAAGLDTPEVGSSGQTIRAFYSLAGSGV